MGMEHSGLGVTTSCSVINCPDNKAPDPIFRHSSAALPPLMGIPPFLAANRLSREGMVSFCPIATTLYALNARPPVTIPLLPTNFNTFWKDLMPVGPGGVKRQKKITPISRKGNMFSGYAPAMRMVNTVRKQRLHLRFYRPGIVRDGRMACWFCWSWRYYMAFGRMNLAAFALKTS